MTEYRTLFETASSFFLEFDGFTDVGFFYLNEEISLIFTFPQEVLHPNHWNHLCISINDTSYKVVGNGNLWFEAKHAIKEVTQSVQTLELGGDSPYNYEYKFEGSISELNMWSTSLSLVDLQLITRSCGVPSISPTLLKWSQVAVLGTTLELDLCNDDDQKVTKLIPVQLDFQRANQLCEIMGAKLSYQIDSDNLENGCGELRVSPIVRNQEGTWIDFNSKDKVDMSKKWAKFQPNGFDIQECTYYNISDGKFTDITCDNEDCFTCAWDKTPRLHLKGLCQFSEIDSQYYLDPDLSYDGNLVFVGYRKNYMIFSKQLDSWLIIGDSSIPPDDSLPEKILAKANMNKYGNNFPLGTHLWEMSDGEALECGDTRVMKLTTVSTYNFSVELNVLKLTLRL